MKIESNFFLNFFILSIMFYSSGCAQDYPSKQVENDLNPKKIIMTEKEWKEKLTEQQYYVTREKGTERSGTGEYDKFYEEGTYNCVCCGNPLFSSETKFNSHSGWPSFYQSIGEDNVDVNKDNSFGMTRTEAVCSHCDAHLGHIFDDGPDPTGLRYCINSVSLKFEKK